MLLGDGTGVMFKIMKKIRGMLALFKSGQQIDLSVERPKTSLQWARYNDNPQQYRENDYIMEKLEIQAIIKCLSIL
jgi:hypothetical protein